MKPITIGRRRAPGMLTLPLLIGLSAMRTGVTSPTIVPHADAVSEIFHILDSVPLVAIGDLHLRERHLCQRHTARQEAREHGSNENSFRHVTTSLVSGRWPES